jgi:hypothetical protein
MVEIVLNQLLHVLIDAARDIRGNPVNPRLQFRGKMHFHGQTSPLGQ